MFRKNSLKEKLILLFTTIVFIGMLTILLTGYLITTQKQKQQYIEYNIGLLELSAQNIATSLKQIIEISLSPYTNASMYKALLGNDTASNDDIKATIKSMLNSNSYVNQVHVYSKNKSTDFVGRNQTVYLSKSAESKVLEYKYDQVSLSYQDQKAYGFLFNRNQAKKVLTLNRQLFSIPGELYLGELDIDVDIDSFIIPNESLITSDEETIVFLKDTELIYTYSNLAQEKITQILASAVIDATSGSCSVNTDKAYTLVYCSVVTGMNVGPFILAKIIPDSAINKNAQSFGMTILLTGVLVMAISLVLITNTASHFVAPFGYIESKLAELSKGNFDVKLDIRGSEEFSVFAKQFNEMVSSINSIILNEYKLDLENKNNQIRALHAQLSPHFINNTLQSIGAEALKKDNLELYQAVTEFGSMMRYVMNFQDMEVLFYDEITYTENYMRLQKLRFSKSFTYLIDAKNEAYQVKVPKLILQPLVENVFKYGFSDDINHLEIKISARINDGFFQMTCSNTGCGLSEKKLSDLKASLIEARSSKDDPKNMSIGLVNLSKRLFIMYGKKSCFNISSENGKGFSVELSFPLEEYNA